MALKQITPPNDIAFLKSGLSLVGEEHGKVGSASNLWFKPTSSKQMHLLRIYLSPKPKKKVN